MAESWLGAGERARRFEGMRGVARRPRRRRVCAAQHTTTLSVGLREAHARANFAWRCARLSMGTGLV